MTTLGKADSTFVPLTAPPLEGWSMGYPSRRGPKPTSERKIPLKGLFTDGVWKCNCDPRMPAERFQTKNGGKNHGRWFYTCQKAQHQRCNFFLWQDEARPREGKAVLNNSRNEPMTPTKASVRSFEATPQSRQGKSTSPGSKTPYEPVSKHTFETPIKHLTTEKTSPAHLQSNSEEFFDWPASDDEELAIVADQQELHPPQTPRKAVRISPSATPRKRLFGETESPENSFLTTHDDVFSTPSTSVKATGATANSGLLSPQITPTPGRFKNVTFDDSDLATEIITALKRLYVPMPEEAICAIQEIAGKHVIKTQGIAKGRDISRAALKTKDGTIAELQGRIAAFEAERESNRAVVAHLKRTLETRDRAEALDAAGKGNGG